jgi:hypothetical protein
MKTYCRNQLAAEINRITTYPNQGDENLKNAQQSTQHTQSKPKQHSRRQITAQSLITSFYPSGRPPDLNLTQDNDTPHTQIPRV